ncbi:MAG: FliM/FliN family flagellar motor switch protein [Parasphingorhabdus sp.]|uniref:FliM/FliN family flagellar motor switch protein n=1 Tax=Parasphingorhabdus sp. TaxID=2709688 RepID=UPI0030017311
MSNPSTENMSSGGATADNTASRAPIEHSLLKKGGADVSLLTAYRKVEKRMGGQLKGHLMNVVGAELAVELAQNDATPYTGWLDAQDASAVYLEYHSGIAGPQIWVRISRLFLTGCVDCFFGGQFDGQSCAEGKLTRSEVGMIERLAQAIGDCLTESWSVLLEANFRYAGYCFDKDDLEMELDDPNIIVSSTRIALSGHAVHAIDFMQSVDGLLSIEPQLNRHVSREIDQVDPVWKRSMKESFDQVYMPVRSVLARPIMDLSQLSKLAVGDILPVSPTDNVPLIVGDRVFAYGSIGEQNGGVAFKIKQFL